jgi:hypothetical protein
MPRTKKISQMRGVAARFGREGDAVRIAIAVVAAVCAALPLTVWAVGD